MAKSKKINWKKRYLDLQKNDNRVADEYARDLQEKLVELKRVKEEADFNSKSLKGAQEQIQNLRGEVDRLTKMTEFALKSANATESWMLNLKDDLRGRGLVIPGTLTAILDYADLLQKQYRVVREIGTGMNLSDEEWRRELIDCLLRFEKEDREEREAEKE